MTATTSILLRFGPWNRHHYSRNLQLRLEKWYHPGIPSNRLPSLHTGLMTPEAWDEMIYDCHWLSPGAWSKMMQPDDATVDGAHDTWQVEGWNQIQIHYCFSDVKTKMQYNNWIWYSDNKVTAHICLSNYWNKLIPLQHLNAAIKGWRPKWHNSNVSVEVKQLRQYLWLYVWLLAFLCQQILQTLVIIETFMIELTSL